jgi:hypothetical protein
MVDSRPPGPQMAQVPNAVSAELKNAPHSQFTSGASSSTTELKHSPHHSELKHSPHHSELKHSPHHFTTGPRMTQDPNVVSSELKQAPPVLTDSSNRPLDLSPSHVPRHSQRLAGEPPMPGTLPKPAKRRLNLPATRAPTPPQHLAPSTGLGRSLSRAGSVSRSTARSKPQRARLDTNSSQPAYSFSTPDNIDIHVLLPQSPPVQPSTLSAHSPRAHDYRSSVSRSVSVHRPSSSPSHSRQRSPGRPAHNDDRQRRHHRDNSRSRDYHSDHRDSCSRSPSRHRESTYNKPDRGRHRQSRHSNYSRSRSRERYDRYRDDRSKRSTSASPRHEHRLDSPTPSPEPKPAPATLLEPKPARTMKDILSSCALIRQVTQGMEQLHSNNFEVWRKQWERMMKHLHWDPSWKNNPGSSLLYIIPLSETAEERNTRLTAAQMLKTTIHTIHDDWLAGTDDENPQAIIKRMSEFFNGTDPLPRQIKLTRLLHTVTMENTNNTLVKFGVLVRDLTQKLTDLGKPPDMDDVVQIYLIGLLKQFDNIRFEQLRLIAASPDKPMTLNNIIANVENWTGRLADNRDLFNLTSGSQKPASNITTLLSKDVTISTGARENSFTNSGTPPQPGQVKTSLCPRWQTREGCKLGDSCKSLHVTPTQYWADKYCNSCKGKGHSERWGKCPTKLKFQWERDQRPTSNDKLLKTLVAQVAELTSANTTRQNSTVFDIPDDASGSIFHG